MTIRSAVGFGMTCAALACSMLVATSVIAQDRPNARDRAAILSSSDPAGRASQDRYGYSEAVSIDGTVYLSGVVVGLGEKGDTLEAAYDRAFRHIGEVLHRAGLDWRDVVDMTSFHTDLTTQLDVMSKVKARYITPPFPAWTAIGVSRLVPDRGLTEIKVIARAASGSVMSVDRSLGWEAVADRFVAIRSGVGEMLVRSWARDNLAPSSAILDIGCGSGLPIARALADDGFAVSGIDASPSLIAAFRRNIPDAPAACEPVQDSGFFGRTFAGVVSIGLVFLLDRDDQRTLLGRVARALEPGGRFLFSAPQEACEWRDTLTGRVSSSLGRDAYEKHLNAVGLNLAGCSTDEGGNHYYSAVIS